MVAVAWVVLALLAIVLEVWLGHPLRAQVADARSTMTDDLMIMATVVALAGPLLVAVSLGGAWRLGPAAPAVGIALAGAGLALRATAMRTLGESYLLTPAIRQGHLVVTGGPYRLLRHPGYCGIALHLVGLAVVVGSAVGLVCLLPLVCFLPIRIRVEEQMLERHFGEGYVDYASATRFRLVPGLY